jgi:phosphotransferase system enzyme I (PtsP)
MFPMIAEVAEFEAARAVLDLERERAASRGTALPRRIDVGIMIEVPALMWQLDALLPRVDFVSVGTNDLVQFLFAADRGNPRLADRYDTLSPPMLRLLADLAARCRERGVELTVCGEMAGHPLEAMALVGLGYRRLSMAATGVGPVKTMVRSLHAAPLQEFINNLLKLPDHSVRGKLQAFARDHHISI